MANLIDKRILDEIYISHIPAIEQTEAGKYVFCGDKTISTSEELEEFLGVCDNIANEFDKKYPSTHKELFFRYVNTYLVIKNSYSISNYENSDLCKEYIIPHDDFDSNHLNQIDIYHISSNLDLLIKGLYEIRRFNLTTDGLNLDIAKSDYTIFPVVTNKGVKVSIKDNEIVIMYRCINKTTLMEIKKQIESYKYPNEVMRLQLTASMERLIKRSLQITEGYPYPLDTEEKLDDLKKVGYDAIELFGVDISHLFE